MCLSRLITDKVLNEKENQNIERHLPVILTMLQWARREDDRNFMDKEREFLPILQKVDSLAEDIKFLIEKLKQIENNIKEIRKEIWKI